MANTRKSVLSEVTPGDVFNNHEVLEVMVALFSNKPTYRHFSVRVKCLTCGNEKELLRSHLNSVGCKAKRCGTNRRSAINVGDIIGKLEVISLEYDDRYSKYDYRCRCACGDLSLYRKLTRRRSMECNKCLVATIAQKNTLPDMAASLNRLIGKYKKRAKTKGYAYHLTNVVFIELVKQDCYYCGSPPREDHEGYVRNGIDRIESTLGYTVDNCRPCCVICNRAKSDLPYAEFIDWVRRLKLQMSEPRN